jgi:N-acetylglucosaminyldiphosphoundecaprenol N-acetyl-beta-D-mannosaminyltransferase
VQKAPTDAGASPPAVPRYSFLDTYVDGYSVGTFLQRVAACVARGERLLVAHHNTHSLALMQDDAVLRRLYARVDTVFVDGMGAVLVARALDVRVRLDQRVAVLDWIWPLLSMAEERGWRVVHLGGPAPMLAEARQAVAERHPEASFTTIDGYFDAADPEQNGSVLERVAVARPDVLLIGMGMPRQESWLHDNAHALPDCVTITVGGILGFVSGRTPTPPRWIGRWGLEWLFRLVTEPTRLWRRYLVEPLPLVPIVARQARASRRARAARRAL